MKSPNFDEKLFEIRIFFFTFEIAQKFSREIVEIQVSNYEIVVKNFPYQP